MTHFTSEKVVVKSSKDIKFCTFGQFNLEPVWPDLVINWTLGNFLKPLATINLPKSVTFLDNFCKGVKIYHFSTEIIFRQLL